MSDVYKEYKVEKERYKELYPDALLAIQIGDGDTFRFFDGDAEKVAEVTKQSVAYYATTRKKRQPYVEIAGKEIKAVFEKLIESGFIIVVLERL